MGRYKVINLCIMILGLFLGSGSSNAASNQEGINVMSLEDRIGCQQAIEEVYWKHRIWPKENPRPKPSLESILSKEQLKEKVEEYLRKSNALKEYWKRPITGQQLQAEIYRMAHNTKRAVMLKELWQSLRNDPYLIAECLARPTLSARLLQNWYTGGHAVRDFSGFVVGDQEDSNAEFDKWWQNSQAQFSTVILEPHYSYTIPIINDSSCMADTWQPTEGVPDGGSNHVAVWTGSEMIVWGAGGGGASDGCESHNRGGKYNPDTDIWIATSIIDAPSARCGATAVWTGTEMIIWGGSGNSGLASGSGRYNPVTDTWMTNSHENEPEGRIRHSAIWTGSEMIIWGGGSQGEYNPLNTGYKYNLANEAWTSIDISGAPVARGRHTAVWSGSEMIIWGGTKCEWVPFPPPGFWYCIQFNNGARYNPVTDSWAAIATTNAPQARDGHTAVWTGIEMIIWGSSTYYYNSGGRYNPGTNSWSPTSTVGAPSGRSNHSAVWTGTEMIIWGGYNGSTSFNDGGRYFPGTDLWVPVSSNGVPTARSGHTAIWTGSEMIIWGGGGNYTGGRYSPGLDSWIPTGTVSGLTARANHTALWTGTEMIIWGGHVYNTYYDSGSKYDPVLDSWTALTSTNAPTPRVDHSAIWTGIEMIVWGGTRPGYYEFNTGGKYNPLTNAWLSTSTIYAPANRHSHSAIWTGSEMIIWGGCDTLSSNDVYFNSGAKYNPNNDSWLPTSMNNVPIQRTEHSAVWTGIKMIIWGGVYCDYNGCYYLNSGGQYEPGPNVWTNVSTVNAPVRRKENGAAWTGTEMIVWGGVYYENYTTYYLDSGGRYNPNTDSWSATSLDSVPTARRAFGSIWTGQEFVIWGGYNDNLFPADEFLNTGGRYNPLGDTWMPTSILNAPQARYYHSATKTGNEMIVWGGHYYGEVTALITGGRYCLDMPCNEEPIFAGLNSAASGSTVCQINLTWDAASSNCSSLLTYHIYRSTDPDFVPSPSNRIAFCITGTTYTDAEVQYGTIYYYIVRAEDSTSNGEGPCNSGNIDANVIKKSATPYYTITVFEDNFETGLNYWDFIGNWNWSNLIAHSGTHSAYSGNVSNQCDTLTLKNAIELPLTSNLSMKFWTYFRMQEGYDGGILEASTNGINWSKLNLTPNYPGITNLTYACIGVHQSCFTGDAEAWQLYSADLSSYAGNWVKIRFKYASDSSINIRGWFIDDLNVQINQSCISASHPPGTVPDNDNFPGAPFVLSKSGNELLLQWSVPGGSCMTSDYEIYRGTLPWSGYNYTSIICTTGSSTTATIAADAGSYYYLVVAQNAGNEGSYGLDSSNAQRPAAALACLPQQIGTCN